LLISVTAGSSAGEHSSFLRHQALNTKANLTTTRILLQGTTMSSNPILEVMTQAVPHNSLPRLFLFALPAFLCGHFPAVSWLFLPLCIKILLEPSGNSAILLGI
jgi:hypothetical protein